TRFNQGLLILVINLPQLTLPLCRQPCHASSSSWTSPLADSAAVDVYTGNLLQERFVERYYHAVIEPGRCLLAPLPCTVLLLLPPPPADIGVRNGAGHPGAGQPPADAAHARCQRRAAAAADGAAANAVTGGASHPPLRRLRHRRRHPTVEFASPLCPPCRGVLAVGPLPARSGSVWPPPPPRQQQQHTQQPPAALISPPPPPLLQVENPWAAVALCEPACVAPVQG
ncbi:hypothetical protein HK405_006446, partial [Cladochytrium tenue]